MDHVGYGITENQVPVGVPRSPRSATAAHLGLVHLATLVFVVGALLSLTVARPDE